MRLAFRPTTPADFRAGLAIIRDRFVYDEAAQERLLDLWSEVLGHRSGVSDVVEDLDRPPASRIVGFGLNVFVSDEFVREAKTTLPPYMGRNLLERWACGVSPILRPESIRRANDGDGLNVLTLHYGFHEWGYAAEEIVMISTMLLQSSLPAHRGYRLKEVLIEAYGEQEFSILLNAGLSLRTDYASTFSHTEQVVDPDRRAYLCGATRQEALGRHGTFAATFLLPASSPRFGFADRERNSFAMRWMEPPMRSWRGCSFSP